MILRRYCSWMKQFVLAALLPCAAGYAQTAAPEVRAMWISRFEWPSSSQSVAKANIDNHMALLKANNFNTVLFQVRGQCDVLYPSPDEPWTNTFNWTNPGWDPLQYAIDAAHAQGLEFHAYINTHTLAAPLPPANTNPVHQYHLHGPNVPNEQSWMIRNSAGIAGLVDSYYWISPANTEASAWTRKQIMHVVKNYNVDGVHFDRIRSPGNTYTFDHATQTRWNNGAVSDSNPDGLNLGDFMRSQITRDLRNIMGEINYYKPWVKTSAAPFGIVYKDATTSYTGTGTQSYHSWYQDSWGWLRYHTLDFMVPQIYWEMGSAHPFDRLLNDWQKYRYGRWIVAGSTTGSGSKTPYKLLQETWETRNQSAAGHCIFSIGSMGNYWSPYKTAGAAGTPAMAAPYSQPAPVPQMPWKTNPTVGTITGYVVNTAGQPVVDARINLAGDTFKTPSGTDYNYLSAHDGFFAILDVAPGTGHQLNASKTTVGRGRKDNLTVAAGSVTSVTIVLSNKLGILSLDKLTHTAGSTVTISLRDDDLAGSAQVMADSGVEQDQVLLVQTAPGQFQGTLRLTLNNTLPGDGRIKALPGSSLTVTYADADTGDGTSGTATAVATILDTTAVVLESRTASGAVTPAPVYVEASPDPLASWANTTAKSKVAGVAGSGARWVGNNGLGASVTFTAEIPVTGQYDIAITGPDSVSGPNANSPGAEWQLFREDNSMTTGTVDLNASNAALANQWMTIATGVPYSADEMAVLKLINRNTNTSNSGNRFNIDAVRFMFNGVTAIEEWPLY